MMNLADLEILALDCQATGANPAKGCLLEMGWLQTRAAASTKPKNLPVKSYLVELPPDIEIPRAVQRVTGIANESMEKALPAARIWREMVKIAHHIAAANRTQRCITVIHYARFEKPFLADLHAEYGSSGDFPLRIICTHEIARRLLPGLPRRGLRAVAGYFGHTVPPSRRSADHAVATAVIWRKFVRQLKTDHGIQNVDQLTGWLSRTTPRRRTGREYPMKRSVRLNLPEKPGIYRMLRSNGDLLYIGKAASLRQRVNSYFRQKGPLAEHTLEMLSQASNLEVTLTGSALEAAILESDEIKRLCPPYNVALQKGQRKLGFCSRDLRECSVGPDKTHPIGPLPEGSLTAAMVAFGAWYQNRQIPSRNELVENGYSILGVPEAYAPEPDCLAEGLTLFRDNYRARLTHPSPLQTLTRLGRELWHEHLEALEKSQTDAPQEPDEAATEDRQPETEDAPNWTPETVARGIEKFIARSALLIRRARWLCLLSESSLAWETRVSSGSQKTVLLFTNGAVHARDEQVLSKKPPVSPGYAKKMARRRKTFDLTTYDRLRVVTTELRRLIAEGRDVEIRFSPRAVLNRRHLVKVLPWV